MVKTNKIPPQKYKKGKVIKKQSPNSNSNPISDTFLIPSSSCKSDRLVKNKVFDKNKWRAQKYSLRSKVENWQNKRTQQIRHEFLKSQTEKNNPIKFDVQEIYKEEERREQEEANFADNENSLAKFTDQSQNKNINRKRKAKSEIMEEKEKAKQKCLSVKADKEVAMEAYRKNKLEKHKKLNKKTKRGQPVMRGRMELLLEKIQENLSS